MAPQVNQSDEKQAKRSKRSVREVVRFSDPITDPLNEEAAEAMKRG